MLGLRAPHILGLAQQYRHGCSCRPQPPAAPSRDSGIAVDAARSLNSRQGGAESNSSICIAACSRSTVASGSNGHHWQGKLAGLATGLAFARRKCQRGSRLAVTLVGKWARTKRWSLRIAPLLVVLFTVPWAAWAYGGQVVAQTQGPALSLFTFCRSCFGTISQLVQPCPERDILMMLWATTMVVPLVRTLKLSPIIGFLLMGIVMGPSCTNLITDVKATEFLAEFGIIFFLFEMGLELSLEKVLAMRFDVFCLGGGQFIGTGVLIACFAALLMPTVPTSGLVVLGGALALSSSAFVLQLIRDKGQLGTRYGRASFGALLFQDMAVVPLLVMVPLLAQHGGGSLLSALGAAAGRGLLGLATIFVLGKFVLDTIFTYVVQSRSPEAFLAVTLGTVLLCANITSALGLSDTLGAFFGGVLLSETHYRHQVEADIAPFRGMLLGLFFTTVGFSIELPLVFSAWYIILPLIMGLMIIKALVMFCVCFIGGVRSPASLQAALLIAPGGEFAFVIFGLASKLRLLPNHTTHILVTATAISMALTPVLFKFVEQLGSSLRNSRASVEGIDEEALSTIGAITDSDNRQAGFVVVFGYGRIGKVVCQLLDIEGMFNYVVLERFADKAIMARSAGLNVFLADCTSKETLEKFNVGKAKLIVVAIADEKVANQVVAVIQEKYGQDLNILLRAQDARHQDEAKRRFNVDAFIPALPADSALLALPFGGEVLTRIGVEKAEVNALIEEQRRSIYQEEHGLRKLSMSDEAIREAFSVVDQDGNGVLSRDEMEQAVQTLDLDISEDDIHLIFEKADVAVTGGITLEDFQSLMGDKFVKYWWETHLKL